MQIPFVPFVENRWLRMKQGTDFVRPVNIFSVLVVNRENAQPVIVFMDILQQ